MIRFELDEQERHGPFYHDKRKWFIVFQKLDPKNGSGYFYIVFVASCNRYSTGDFYTLSQIKTYRNRTASRKRFKALRLEHMGLEVKESGL